MSFHNAYVRDKANKASQTFLSNVLLKEHGATIVPLLVIFHLANFHQIFDLRDLISTYSFIQGFYSKRSDCTKNLPDFKAKTQNRQKLYRPCLPWQGYLHLDSL
jgi:hypothetical protein